MTVSSAAWGQVAAKVGLKEALLLAAAGVMVAIPLSWPWKLHQIETVDLSPSLHWRPPDAAEDIEDERGPVLVKIEYLIDPKDRARFLSAIDHWAKSASATAPSPGASSRIWASSAGSRKPT